MSNYIPTYTKKRQRQTKVENDLRRLIAKCAQMNKLVEAAEVVRAARIRTIYAKRQHCCIFGSTDRYDVQIAVLKALSAESILEEFGMTVEGSSSAESERQKHAQSTISPC